VDAKEVLYFEFIDGDLKRQVIDPESGQITNAFRKLRGEDLKIPVFSQAQMTKLITKRNEKFTSAVNKFLNDCESSGSNPEEKLKDDLAASMPMMSVSRNNTPGPQEMVAPASIPKDRASIAQILNEIKSLEWYTEQIVTDGHRVFDPQEPIFGELNFELSQALVNALYNARGITQLYAHQAEAINNLYEGHNVIISTSTSSGKSLIYQIPVLHELERDPETRAIYIFPTKALAQDQSRSMKEMFKYMDGLQHVR
jgi:DEAD/DEAH box helicase domain-containing protein